MISTLARYATGPARAWILAAMSLFAASGTQAQNVDLVVTMVSNQPAYMAQDLEHYTVTVSNNGPATASNVNLEITHPLAHLPFETSATCQPVAGPNPNGPAVCPPGSGSAPSPAFVRSGTSFSVTIPSIPSQSMARIEFDNTSPCEPERNQGGAIGECILPNGNYTLTAEATSAGVDSDPVTNRAITNIYVYPPDSQYRIRVTSAPASASPGDVVDYEFEVYSIGLNPSHMLRLGAELRGLAGNMTPLSSSNAPHGANTSTLPATRLLSIDCLSMSLGSYPATQVFPAVPSVWQACPSTGVIPIPQPVSSNNTAPVRGFLPSYFLENLPGTQLGPSGGGVMRFRARVEVGEPTCVAVPETGYRDLEFRVTVAGVPGTDLVAPGPADNIDTVLTQVPGTCQEADIELTTVAVPSTFALDSSGHANWTHQVTVSNLSTGATAGTATQIPVDFGHYSTAFSETRLPLTCTSSPAGLCPTAAELSAGVLLDTTAGFRFAGTLASLPPGASVTFSQDATLERTACWGYNEARIQLKGAALPSPTLFDPNYNPAMSAPPDFTPGINPFFGNNGMQTIATVTGLTPCPGGGGSTDLEIIKTGPYASAADAAAGGPLIGQNPGAPIADGTQVFFRLVVRNPDAANPVDLGRIDDWNYNASGLQPGNSGFIHSGAPLAAWGISCTGQPASAPCHELASSPQASGYVNTMRIEYDPAQHGGNAYATLAPLASLTYIVPFTTPSHLNRCHGPTHVGNSAQASYASALGTAAVTPMSYTYFYIGNPPCTPGQLQLQKQVLAPASASHIPTSGVVSFRLELTNLSSTETLDIARLVDQPIVSGVQASVVSVTCNTLSGGAKCPTNAVIPGQRTPATGAPTPLPNPYDIDHEWGSVGNATFPPGSALEFILTYQLTEPTRSFNCLGNGADFSGENDPNGWVPSSQSVWICPPPAPELSLQKRVDQQIVAPGAWVTYTLIVTNIGAASADGAQLIDPMPAALQAANPSGYSNITCTDITNSSYIPNPHGVAVCPSVGNGPGGLNATIATLGPNTALQFTYQAQMPNSAGAPVSIANVATLMSPSSGGLSFGGGTAQSHQNVQVLAPTSVGPPPAVIAVPALQARWLALLAAMLVGLGLWRAAMRAN